MNLLEDLGGWLDSQLGTLTLGTNFFYSLMPENVSNCAALYQNTGAPPSFTMGSNNLPILERPQIQFLVRNSSYTTANSLSDSMYRVLTAIANQTINGRRYLRVEAIGFPALLERDSNNRAIFSCNFDVIRVTP
jgi:hypothetical protein